MGNLASNREPRHAFNRPLATPRQPATGQRWATDPGGRRRSRSRHHALIAAATALTVSVTYLRQWSSKRGGESKQTAYRAVRRTSRAPQTLPADGCCCARRAACTRPAAAAASPQLHELDDGQRGPGEQGVWPREQKYIIPTTKGETNGQTRARSEAGGEGRQAPGRRWQAAGEALGQGTL